MWSRTLPLRPSRTDPAPPAREAARLLGVDGDTLVRQGQGSTSAVFAGADVVVIVAPPYADPAAVAAKLALAAALADGGSFVRPLWDQPRRIGDALVTAWERIRPAPGPIDWEAAGRAVRAFHGLDPARIQAQAGIGLSAVADCRDIVAGIERLCARRRLRPRAAAPLRRAAERLDAELAGLDPRRGLVHGDLHRPNLLNGTGGVVLCDTDEVALGAPGYDLGFLTDPARPSLPAAARAAFECGYGEPLPDVSTARTFARAAHLRRTIAVLWRPPRIRESYFDAARLGAWAAMDTRWHRDLVPVVVQPRRVQVALAMRGLGGFGR